MQLQQRAAHIEAKATRLQRFDFSLRCPFQIWLASARLLQRTVEHVARYLFIVGVERGVLIAQCVSCVRAGDVLPQLGGSSTQSCNHEA